MAAAAPAMDDERAAVLEDFRRTLVQHRETEARARDMRAAQVDLERQFQKTEDDIKATQSVGQTIAEVLRQLDEDRFIVKASSGPRYIVGCRQQINKKALKPTTRVSLDVTTYTIMRVLPQEVDPQVYQMQATSNASFSDLGGVDEQIREVRECIELPLTNPELFLRVGINPPKGVLLYGPPGTGKTLMARALAASIKASFLTCVASSIVDKYIGESARVIRELFAYARTHEPTIIFMDEIDAIGGSRFSEGNSSDREIQRTLMALLNELDGFTALGQTKLICASNRPDILDPALMRPGRLDRKVELPYPNAAARSQMLVIHARKLTKRGEIDYDAVASLADGFNGADMRNICSEAGMLAIRDERSYVTEADFMKATRKLLVTKKLESKMSVSLSSSHSS